MADTNEVRAGSIWFCKIGEHSPLQLGADSPMRDAVAAEYKKLTGCEPKFIFSGWGGELTEGERAVVENREPVLEATPPADAALDDAAIIELVTDYAQSKVRAESCRYHYESKEYDKEAADTLEQIRAALRARAVQAISHCATLAHSGGMIADELDVLCAIRKITLPWFDGSGTLRQCEQRATRAMIFAAQQNKEKGQ